MGTQNGRGRSPRIRKLRRPMRSMNSVQEIDHLDEECRDARDSVEQTVDDRMAVCRNVEAPFRASSYGKRAR